MFLFVFVLRICLAHSSLLIFYVQPDNAWPDIHAMPYHAIHICIYVQVSLGIWWRPVCVFNQMLKNARSKATYRWLV